MALLVSSSLASQLSSCGFRRLASVGLAQHPGDAARQVLGVERFGQVAGVLVGDDVRQATGVEGDDWGGAGVGFDAGVGQIVLARSDHHGIGGAVERTQAEVVVQMAAVVDGKAQRGWRLRRALTEDEQLEVL